MSYRFHFSRLKLFSEQIDDLVDLVRLYGSLATFQLTGEPDSNARPLREFNQSEVEELSK